MNKTNKLLVLKGLPGCGKSKYAEELVAQGWKRVNKDDLRLMIDCGKWSRDNEKPIPFIEFHIAAYYLENGFNVVVDDTNFGWEDKWREEAKTHGAEFEIKVFDTLPLECIERDRKRGDKSVGAEVIYRMYNQYMRPKPVPYQKDLPDAYIFDIDGTLAKMNGRSPYDYTRVSEDSLNEHVANILDSLVKTGAHIIICSGRQASCRTETSDWLAQNDITYHNLLMRSTDDKRKDSIVKEELYNEHIKGKYNVLGVFDDRDQVVELWRNLGLTCFQVDYGAF